MKKASRQQVIDDLKFMHGTEIYWPPIKRKYADLIARLEKMSNKEFRQLVKDGDFSSLGIGAQLETTLRQLAHGKNTAVNAIRGNPCTITHMKVK